MNEQRYDLHCHSTCSDGELTPLELIDFAKECNLAGLSITDHDTVAAYTEELFQTAKEKDLELIIGVELSTHLKKTGVHVLGYSMDLQSPELQTFCIEQKKRRLYRNTQIIEKLNKLGYKVTVEELYKGKEDIVVGRPHIAELLCEKGYVSTTTQAFGELIREGKPAYSPGRPFHPQDAINVIHQAKGKAVIAHPHLFKKPSVLRQLMELNFDGMECHYCLFPANKNARMCQLADKKGWLRTGGSDYHGPSKPFPKRLGCSYITKDQIEALI